MVHNTYIFVTNNQEKKALRHDYNNTPKNMDS